MEARLEPVISYKTLYRALLTGDKALLIPLGNDEARVPYAINNTDVLLEKIDYGLKVLENIDRQAEIELGYQKTMDGYCE